MNKPPKAWTCFCHKCGTSFPTLDAIAVVCPPCTAGPLPSNPFADIFGDFFGKSHANSKK